MYVLSIAEKLPKRKCPWANPPGKYAPRERRRIKMPGISAVLPSPIGPLTLGEDRGFLTHLLFGRDIPPGYAEGSSDLLKQAEEELSEYFSGARREFSLPIKPAGTPFQRRVWAALLEIPYGETRSYKDIAAAAGCPKGFRAVGMANHNNPISIIIPCHRVVGANGRLTGYGGGLKAKAYLLELERKFS